MDKLDLMLALRYCGARLLIVHDYWGGEHAMLKMPGIGWPRFRVRLTTRQAQSLRERLRSEVQPGTGTA